VQLEVERRARRTRTCSTRFVYLCPESKAALTYCQGIDFVQEKFLKQGDQSNESAIEQAKDEAISDFIRSKYVS
jgi:hypothetical protein